MTFSPDDVSLSFREGRGKAVGARRAEEDVREGGEELALRAERRQRFP
jgi:hypothetical protein